MTESTEEKPESDSVSDSSDHNDTDYDGAFKIGAVIDCLIHRVLDIEDCAREYVTAATERYNHNAERLKKEISEAQELLDEEEDQNKRLVIVKDLRKTLRDVDRHNSSSPVDTLEKSLFISLFAAFDKYVGDLVTALYSINPDLYKNINREISLSETLKHNSMEELRQTILEKEVESLRRKSYVDQFKDLENKFSIKLTKFDEWPYFVERSQRRNLFTHCDGVVSKQYLDVCREAGVKFKENKQAGDQLDIGAKYFFQSCMLITQVAVMLGQTLMRKTMPDDIEKADTHLSRLIFDLLHMEHWQSAIALCKFAHALPEISTDEMERIFSVNYAIALKAIGKDSAARNVLDRKDWTATTYDFKLAYAILTDNYAKAEEIMFKIGKQGELITELAYHDWPLFRDFRDSREFFSAYEKIYGYKYSSKLSELANDKKTGFSEANEEESGPENN